MSDKITPAEMVIDSRQVIERIADLLPFKVEYSTAPDSDLSSLEEFATRDEAQEFISGHPDAASLVIVEYKDESQELKNLREFAAQGESFHGWYGGITFYHEDYMHEVAREEAEEEFGADRIRRWPLTEIDWKEAADAHDWISFFSELDWQGVAFYTR